MKIRPSKLFSRIMAIRTIGLIGALLLWGPWTMAAAPETGNTKIPIQITADKLVTDHSASTAEFTGNVRAVQGNTEVVADRLKLFYAEGETTDEATEGRNIDRIEAYGQVRISFDNKVAVGDQAIYITKERKLILQGTQSKVISGQDEITGSKITFYRDDGRVILDSDAKTRVKAIIHSDQRGLN